MSSTRFESEGGSSSRRLLYIQVEYNLFCIHQYKLTYKTAYTDICKSYYTVPAYTTVFLFWTFAFETRKRVQKIKKKNL